MRRSFGLLVAATLVLPIGVMHAPAGAAASGPVCSTAAGSLVFSPALPVLSKSSLVKSAVAATGTLGKCAGGGVVSAHTVFKAPKSGTGWNCKTLLGSSSKGFVGTETVTWNTGRTSTVTLTLKPANNRMTVDGTVTAGAYAGSTQTGQFQLKLPTGTCTTKPLSKLTYTNVAGVKGVFK